MRSLKFPRMFSANSTNVWLEDEHKQATTQNLITLLYTERGELFGDPYYGLMFKHYLFSQNDQALADAIIDIIYTQVALFMPQLKINRNNIQLLTDQEKGKLYCEFVAIDQIDFTVDTYQLLLLSMENNI